MNVNALNLVSSMNTQTQKVQSNSLNGKDSFDSFVKPSNGSSSNKAQDSKSTTFKLSDENVSKIQSSDTYKENKEDVDTDQNDDSKMETYLKKAGFTDEEITDIKEKIKDGSIDKNSVFLLLSLLLGNNQNIQSKSNEFLNTVTKELSNEISSISNNTPMNFKGALGKTIDEKFSFLVDMLNNFDKSGQLTQKLSEKIADNIAPKLSELLPGSTGNDVSDLKSQIYSELLQKLNPKLASNLNSEKNISGNNLFQIINENRQMVKNLDTTGSSLQNSSNNENSTGDNSKGTDILNKILGNSGEDTKDSKISKAVNFMTQFNNIKGESILANGIDTQNLSLNKATFNSDIIKTLKYMDLNNIKELTVKINPKELGDITINLVMQEGKMKAVLTASNKDAYNLLNSNIQDLSNKLQQNDIKVQSFSLNLYHEDTTFFKNESNKNESQNSGKRNKGFTVNSVQEEDVPEENDYYNENNVNMLA